MIWIHQLISEVTKAAKPGGTAVVFTQLRYSNPPWITLAFIKAQQTKVLRLKPGHLSHLSPPGAGVCCACVCVYEEECTSSAELGKSHSETDTCLTLSDSNLHLPSPRDMPIHTGACVWVCARVYVRTHFCVQYMFVSKTRQGGAETDPWCSSPIRRIP